MDAAPTPVGLYHEKKPGLKKCLYTAFHEIGGKVFVSLGDRKQNAMVLDALSISQHFWIYEFVRFFFRFFEFPSKITLKFNFPFLKFPLKKASCLFDYQLKQLLPY